MADVERNGLDRGVDPRDAVMDISGLRRSLPPDFDDLLSREIERAGGELVTPGAAVGALGHTMFDSASSEDNSVTVLLPKEHIVRVPSQSLVRIMSRDDRRYLGSVVAGPFAEPDGLRADSNVLVTIVSKGGINFVPQYHGRVQVELLGEEQDGQLVPPRLRPLPNSPVFVLDAAEAERVLRAEGDLALGQVVGQEDVAIAIPSTDKAVLPRHTAILGTTGGGKSTTVARLIEQAQRSGCAVVLLDVEGEYTFLHEPADNAGMLRALERRGLGPAGVANVHLYHLVNRETANPGHPRRHEFSLQFARLSPYAAIEILNLSEAQSERFIKAYDVAKALLRDLDIFPKKGVPEQERLALELDELERGYPRLTLDILMDVVGACLAQADKREVEPRSAQLNTPTAKAALTKRMQTVGVPGNTISWAALLGRLSRLNRLRVFDSAKAGVQPLNYKVLLRPGTVSIVDLSDAGMTELTNIVIADLLRGLQEAQDEAYQQYERRASTDVGTGPSPAGAEAEAGGPARALVIVEEAHEFLSAERIDKTPILFEQIARIAKRGRKRWLGLVFVTQLPQHLPRQVFGLVNSYVLHKITDPLVVTTLERTVSGIDKALWRRLPGLAPGQAIVSFPHLARPLLIAVDPAPCKLRLVE